MTNKKAPSRSLQGSYLQSANKQAIDDRVAASRATRQAAQAYDDQNRNTPQTRVPGALHLENLRKQQLYIEHVPTGFSVVFPAFVTAFGDAYNSSWNSEKVYGRMDAMGTFMHTKRSISMAWEVPAESFEHAMRNLLKINKLISFLYPLYAQGSRDKTASPRDAIGVINQDPLWKVRFGNLIQNSKTGGPLLGFVNGITMDPMVDSGFFYGMTPEGTPEYYPKSIRLNFEFVVLHEHSLGFDASTGRKKQVTVKSAGKMSKTQVTYRFNDPKLNFGNFPYVTTQFAEAVRSEGATVPSIPPPTALADPNLPPPASAADLTLVDQYIWQLEQGTQIPFVTLDAAFKANQLSEKDLWTIYEHDRQYGPASQNITFLNAHEAQQAYSRYSAFYTKHNIPW